MRALLMKNFWLWKPGLSANVFVFAAALAFSLLDAAFEFGDVAWILALLMTALLGQAGGISTLGVDLNKDNIRFLEYLPVRRGHIWLANWIDQLLACLITIVLLTWYRVLIMPPGADRARVDVEPIFAGPSWEIPVGVAVLMFASFSYTLFWRTFFQGDTAALVPTWIGYGLFLIAPAAALMYVQIVPPRTELLFLLLALGSLFSLASFVAFAGPPLYWSKLKRFFSVGLPSVVVLFTIEVIVIATGAQRWKELDWSDPDLHFSATVCNGGKPSVLVNVRSKQSGMHTFGLDPDSGASWYLGRGLRPHTAWERIGTDDRFAFETTFDPGGLMPIPPTLVTMGLRGDDRRALFTLRPYRDMTGGEYYVSNISRTADGRWVSFSGFEMGRLSKPGDGRHALFVIHADGHARRIRPIGPISSSDFLLSDDGVILALVPTADGHEAGAQPKYAFYDIAADRWTTPQVPGQILHVSMDMRRALCRRTSEQDDMMQQSVVIVDLFSGEQVPLIEEKELSLIPRSLGEVQLPMPSIGQRWPMYYTEDPTLVVEADLHHAVWLRQRLDEGTRRLSLVYINLSNGQRRELVPENELPSVGLARANGLTPELTLQGFVDDGRQFVYQVRERMYHVTLVNGLRTETALPAGVSESAPPILSPSGRRLLCTYRRSSNTSEVEGTSYVTEIRESGGDQPLYSKDGYETLSWLDDDRLVFTDHEGVRIINLDRGDVQHVFPRLQR